MKRILLLTDEEGELLKSALDPGHELGLSAEEEALWKKLVAVFPYGPRDVEDPA